MSQSTGLTGHFGGASLLGAAQRTGTPPDVWALCSVLGGGLTTAAFPGSLTSGPADLPLLTTADSQGAPRSFPIG